MTKKSKINFGRIFDKKYCKKKWGATALRAKKKKDGVIVKCGDCYQRIRIFADGRDDMVEIEGPIGSVDQWRAILLPVLGIEEKNGKFVDILKKQGRKK